MERFPNDSFERRRVPRRGPELQFGVARRPGLQQRVAAAIAELYSGDRLRVAAIEAFGQPQDRRERANRPPALAPQVGKAVVAPARGRLAMISRDERHRLDFVGLEAAKVPVFYEVIRVFMVRVIRNMDPDVVEQRRVLEPLAVAVGQRMDAARLVEQAEGEPRHLAGVLGPVVAALGQLDDAATPDVRVAVGLGDLLPVPRDVVEDETLPQRVIAEGHLFRAQAPQDGFEEHGPGGCEVRAARIEPGDS